MTIDGYHVMPKARSRAISFDNECAFKEYAQIPDVTYNPLEAMYAAKRTNLRTGPSIKHEKIGLPEVGEKVCVIARSGAWFRLEPRAGQQRRLIVPRSVV